MIYWLCDVIDWLCDRMPWIVCGVLGAVTVAIVVLCVWRWVEERLINGGLA